MGLVHISEDIGKALSTFSDAYTLIQDGEYQQASKTIISSEIGTDTILFVILPLIVAIISIIFSCIACCYMCCCNQAKKYKQKQQLVDKLILDSVKQCNIQYKKGEDVLMIAKQQNLPSDVTQNIESAMEQIKDNEYKRAKRCLCWSQLCGFIFFGFSIVYCVGLGFMQSSVSKLGKTLPDEKSMIDGKIDDTLDVATSYGQLLDQSLSAIGLTNSSIVSNLITQDNETIFNASMDKFFDDLIAIQPLQNIINDVESLYIISEESRNDLAAVFRNLLYYQQYTGEKPQFVQQGQKAIDDTTDSLNKIDSSLNKLNQMKTQLGNDINKISNFITDVNVNDYDIPSFNDIIKDLNQTIQNIILELKDTTTPDRLARVMLQIKELIGDSFEEKEILDQIIPWTKEGSEIKTTEKGSLVKYLSDELDVDFENIQSQMKEWLPDEDIQEAKNQLYEIYKYIKQARQFKQLTFQQLFDQLKDTTCDNFWCGVIDEEQYNETMNTLSNVPLLKIDKENPQSVISSVTLVLSLLILVIPIIYIVFVILSILCNWKCCSCFSISILPYCSIFASLMLLIVMVFSIPEATVAPITDMMTTDLNELTTQVGDLANDIYTQEELDDYLKYDIDVDSLEDYLQFYQDSQQVSTLKLDFTSFNITESLEQFDYQMKPVYNLEDDELTSNETLFQNLLEMFPGIKQYTQQVNKLLDAFENIMINLNMGNSTINQLFADQKQSILGLIKFGEQNLQDIINQIIGQGLNYAFDKDITNQNGIKGFLQVNENKANDVADNLLNEYIDISEVQEQIQNANLSSTQCVIDKNQETVNKAYKMTDAATDNIATKPVTLFDSITTLLKSTDDTTLADNLNTSKSNLNDLVDTSDIFNNNIVTIENLYSNILLEYLQAQNVKTVKDMDNVDQTINIENASSYIQDNRGKLNWNSVDLTQNVYTDDTNNLQGFESFIKMMNDTTNPNGGCFTVEQLQTSIDAGEFETFKVNHPQPKWWQNITTQRGVSISEQNEFKYRLQGSYCEYIQEVSKQLNTIQYKLNVTSYSTMRDFVYNLNTNIIAINKDFNDIVAEIYNVEKDIFGETYKCENNEGVVNQTYTDTEHIAKDIDKWAQNIFRSTTNNIVQTFKISESNPMPQIVPILVGSKLYNDLPELTKNITNQTLEQVVDENSILNTKLLNTALTTVTDQMEIISDPFNTMALGIYLCLLFCITTPFFACCSYKYIYLKNFEHQRKRKLGVADPYKETTSKQHNKRDRRIEVETTQVYNPVIPQQQPQEQMYQDYQMPQIAIEPNNESTNDQNEIKTEESLQQLSQSRESTQQQAEIKQTIQIADEEKSDRLEGDQEEKEKQIKIEQEKKKCSLNNFLNRFKMPKYFTPQKTQFKHTILYAILSFVPVTFDMTSCSMALPQIAKSYDIDDSLAQWYTTIFYLAQCGLGIPIAQICNKFGQCNSAMFCYLIMGILYIICYFINNFYALLVLRFLCATFASGAIACRNSLSRILPTPQEAQQFMLKSNLVMMLLNIFVPLVCGFIIDYDYRIIFIIAGISSLIDIFVVLPLPNTPQKGLKQSLDFLGSILLFLGLTCLDIGITVISYQLYILMAILVIVGIGILVLFCYVETRVKNPILPLKLMRQPVLEMVISNIFMYMLSSSLSYFMPQTFTRYGKSSTEYSIVSFCAMGMMAVGTIVTARLNKKIINKKLLLFGIGVSLIMLSLMFASCMNWIALSVNYAIHQFFYSIASQLLVPMLLVSVPMQYTAVVSVLPMTARTIGQSLTVCLTSIILTNSYSDFSKDFIATDETPYDLDAWENSLRCVLAMLVVIHLKLVNQEVNRIRKDTIPRKSLNQIQVMINNK